MKYACHPGHTGLSSVRILVVGPILLAAFASGCTDRESPAAPPPGRTDLGWIAVAAVVQGDDIDGDGFVVTVDGGNPRHVAAGEAVVFPNLEPTLHNVRIDGIAPNCVLHGPNTQSVDVLAHEGTTFVFRVICADRSKGAFRVRILTPGFDRFSVIVDDAPFVVSEDGEVVIADLVPGNHTVLLGVDPLACRLDGSNPRTRFVDAGRVTEEFFNLTCPPGSLVVTVRTTGNSQPAGYRAWIVQADDSYCDMGTCRSGQVQGNGSVWFEGLSMAAYQVGLVVPMNCRPITVTQTVQLNAQGVAHAPFTVSCR